VNFVDKMLVLHVQRLELTRLCSHMHSRVNSSPMLSVSMPSASTTTTPAVLIVADHYVTDRGERQALPHLFASALGWVRNPAFHRDVPMDDVTHAIEQLKLESLLQRIADERIAAHRNRSP
jgi:hypothetical protein